jgi:hypothetical protein
MDQHDALVFEILQVLEAPVPKTKKASGTAVATRAPARTENHDPDTGEIIATETRTEATPVTSGAAGEVAGTILTPAAPIPDAPSSDQSPVDHDDGSQVTDADPVAVSVTDTLGDDALAIPPFLQRQKPEARVAA